MTLASNNSFPSVLVVEGATPATPAATKQRFFVSSTTHMAGKVNSSGVVTVLAEVVELVNTVATGGSTQTIPDVTTQTLNYITLTANLTLTFPTAAAGKSFTIALKQDSTARTVTWPGTVKWPAATAPTLTTTSGKIDVFAFVCVDGTNWLGFTSGQNY